MTKEWDEPRVATVVLRGLRLDDDRRPPPSSGYRWSERCSVRVVRPDLHFGPDHEFPSFPTRGAHGVPAAETGGMGRLKDICFDCDDPWTLAHWWAEVLDYRVRPH